MDVNKKSLTLVILLIIVSIMLISYEAWRNDTNLLYESVIEVNSKISDNNYLLIIPETITIPKTAFDTLEHAYCGSFTKINNNIYAINNEFKEFDYIIQEKDKVKVAPEQVVNCDFFIHTHPSGACIYSEADINYFNTWNFTLVGLFCPTNEEKIKIDTWTIQMH